MIDRICIKQAEISHQFLNVSRNTRPLYFFIQKVMTEKAVKSYMASQLGCKVPNIVFNFLVQEILFYIIQNIITKLGYFWTEGFHEVEIENCI